MTEPIPVLMYHSIAPEIEDWAFNFLSIGPEIFEDQVSTLARAGFHAVSLAELHDYVSGKKRLPPKAVVLTFDDGYLDNWVFAFPILRKYGFKATVFVSTDFIDRRDRVRPNLADVWESRTEHADLEWRGFLGEGEMRRLVASDLVDVQGHCKTHTWYPVSSKIVDFHYPGDARPWLAWNARPERKYLYLEEEQSRFVPWGSPVYEHGKAVEIHRYFPDPRMEDALARYVEEMGGVAFFDQPDWRDRLSLRANEITSGGLAGRAETPQEYLTRLREEIVLSKEELASALGRPVDFLCWPGGGYTDTAVEVAREAGYVAWTLGSRDRSSKRNRPGEDPTWIKRTAAAPWWHYRGRKVCAFDGDFLKHVLESYKGFALAGFRLKWFKAVRLFQSYLVRPAGE